MNAKGKAKVKQSWEGPEEVEVPRSAHDGEIVSPTHRPPLLPQEIFLVLISVRG
jgi:hypothetical protein